MLPVKRPRFQLAVIFFVLLATVPAMADRAVAPEVQVQDPFSRIESKIGHLHSRVRECLGGGCAQDREVIWLLSRPAGTSRIVRALNDSRPEWISEADYRRILSTVGGMPLPDARLESDPAEAFKLGTAEGWSESLLILEHATGYPGERLVAVIRPQRFFSKLLMQSGQERRWIFWTDGEVLAQSDGNFLGARFGSRDYFVHRSEATSPNSVQRSFDQADVVSRWKELPSAGLVGLAESVQMPAISGTSWTERVLQLVRGSAAGILILVAFASLRRIRPAWQAWRERRESMQGGLQSLRLPSHQVHSAIYRSKTVRQAGENICAVLSQATGCEFFFLRYDRRRGMLVEPGNAEGFSAVLSDVGIRPSLALPEIPSLQAAVLRYKDASSFMAWPILSTSSRGRVHGAIVVLRPNAAVKALSPSIGCWGERAGRYAEEILGEEPRSEGVSRV